MILITGASSGIGLALARMVAADPALKKRGLFLVARRLDRLKKIKAELSKNCKVEIAALDVSNQKNIDSFAKAHAKNLSGLTALVNNAGLALGLKPVTEITPQEWNTMIDTNLKGLIGMTHLALPYLLKNKTKAPHVVNLGSVAGYITYPKGHVYCATKYAVRAFNEALRLDLMGSGIRVTEIAPGMVETEFSEVRLGDAEAAKKVYLGMTPLKSEDIAECIVWSMKRPAHVNIQSMVVYPTDQASPTQVYRKS